MKYFFTLLIAGFSVSLCLAQEATPSGHDSSLQFPAQNAWGNVHLEYFIINTEQGTYGYDVFADGKMVIHQTTIPGRPGNLGFKTKDDAAKVAEMVLGKIRQGQMPPTIEQDELKTLGIE